MIQTTHHPSTANIAGNDSLEELALRWSYVAYFAFEFGSISSLRISEIRTLKVRGAAMSLVTVTNWALNLVVAVTFWSYGVIAIGAWVFFYFQVAETRGRTLEQIEAHWRSGKAALAL